MRKPVLMIAAISLVIGVAISAMGGLEEGVVLTRDNWTEMVGFKPDLSNITLKPGDMVDKNNLDQYGELVPDLVKILVEKYNLSMEYTDYKPIAPSDGYIDATNKYHRKLRIVDTGDKAREKGIFDYVAGLPFPNPQNGLEVAWNYQYAHNGDDADNYFAVYWISANRGVERWEEWRWVYIVRAMHRTDIEPLPHIPELAKKDIQYSSLTVTQWPFDKKGFSALYSRFEEPKDQEGWIYIPSQRRATRFSFGTRGDAWNNTDLLYEDVRGYMGYPEWMNWKLVGKGTYLAPMHAGLSYGKENIEKNFDFKNPPYWNPKMKWEPRSMYVVEAVPKFKDYPYSKMMCYIDAETYYMIFKSTYDKKGQLWKVLVQAFNDSPDPRKLPPAIGTALAVDLQSEHATVFPWYEMKANIGLDPKTFSLTNLRKMGK